MIRSLKRLFRSPASSKIEVFVRHCHYSSISQHKQRISGFSRQKCLQNLLDTIDLNKANLTFLLDTFYPMEETHFLWQQDDFPIIEIKEGSEAGSFLCMMEIVLQANFSPDTIIYFLEDDYLHRPGWLDILVEGFTLPRVDYVTLYDHRDKYKFDVYQTLESRIMHTQSCHWRTTPSTTNTYAMKKATLERDATIHRAFSENRQISADHEKFITLAKKGATLISSIPGWSTHVESEHLSPCYSWETLLETSV